MPSTDGRRPGGLGSLDSLLFFLPPIYEDASETFIPTFTLTFYACLSL
jgi:hypothetical protein